jgi:hypothetical protein
VPTDSPSGWTVETLKEHLECVISAHDRRYEQRFRDQGAAGESALNAAKEAVLKAEHASEKRFEGVNEFRAALSDQQRTLMPRAEAELRMAANEAQIKTLLESRVERRGESRGAQAIWGYIVGAIGLLLAIASFAIRMKP